VIHDICFMDAAKTSSPEQHNFFVTGLPRTRTAWFSEWLPNCLHEGMEGCYTNYEYIRKLGDSGDSSCMLMFFNIEFNFPESPVVIVERDIDDVAQSLENIGLLHDTALYQLRYAKKYLDKMKGLRVDYENLDMKEIWNYLIGTPFDSERAMELEMKNIQKVNRNPDVQAMVSLIGGV
jgi:hypothetical protein